MPDVSPPLGCPLEIRDVRRFAATMVGRVISRLEKLKWKLEENPSREQVVAWQKTVFEPIREWYPNDVDPDISRANAKQVARYFPHFWAALDAYSKLPDKIQRMGLQSVAAELNRDLAEAYGLPAVPNL